MKTRADARRRCSLLLFLIPLLLGLLLSASAHSGKLSDIEYVIHITVDGVNAGMLSSYMATYPADFVNYQDPEHYTIPFMVWGPGIEAGADLYALSTGVRSDPKTSAEDSRISTYACGCGPLPRVALLCGSQAGYRRSCTIQLRGSRKAVS